MRTLATLMSLAFLGIFGSTLAQAQSTRTWVSGTGDDANPCSRTAPCKTFAGAISKTTAGGEIDALDSGAFGTVTITKDITIDGGGQLAGVLAAGTYGVNINAGSSDSVTLRNLSIQGVKTGISGVRLLNARALHIEHCNIAKFLQYGIDIEPSGSDTKVFIVDTISQDNTYDGLHTGSTGGAITLNVENSQFNNNQNGVFAGDFTRCSIRNSAASGNANAGFIAQANSGAAKINLFNSSAANNLIGIQAGGGSFTSAVTIAGVSLFLNGTGIVPGTNGAINSFGSNFNSGPGTPTATLPLQ